MTTRPFLDTNILLYAFSATDHRKERALEILAEGGIVSVQVLSEFIDVSRRKLKQDWPPIVEALERLAVVLGEPVAVTSEIHRSAVEIARRHGLRIYDSLIVSAARQTGCRLLYSEDMQHRQVIEGVTIRNPFLPA